ncbi:L,D-transpeptidase [Patescibacteria group bacterium]
MTKRQVIFILFIPLLAVVGAMTLTASLYDFENESSRDLEAIVSDGKFVENEKQAYFNGEEIKTPSNFQAAGNELKKVLAAVSDDTKWIEVDLSKQILRGWLGNSLIYEFFVSTGKKQWGADTPIGVYRIWIKLRYTKMEGGSGSTYYYLPNVQCVQFFYKGFGLHGTYWHDNFGHPMSHGCVNMRNEDACTIFYWTSPIISEEQYVARPTKEDWGTRVVVHGETPWE